MRKTLSLAVSVLSLLGCTPLVMVRQAAEPSLKPAADKATLVLFRSKGVGGSATVSTYVDGKFIGQTRGKSYFVAPIDPGAHHLTSIADNKTVSKVTLEPGKVYYVRQDTPFGQASFNGTSASEFEREKGEMDYFVRDSTQPEPLLDAQTHQHLLAEYDEEVKKDPARVKDMLELQGF